MVRSLFPFCFFLFTSHFGLTTLSCCASRVYAHEIFILFWLTGGGIAVEYCGLTCFRHIPKKGRFNQTCIPFDNRKEIAVRVTRILIFVLLAATFAGAQASRTWVSGVGDDANPCSRTAPCKTFAGAISKTASGGEIDALDPAGYGAVTITKALTIDGGGGQVASVLVAGTNGIVVQAGPSDVVILRNLRINGISGSGNGGINGIRFLAGKSLIVENCDIFGFTNNGIDVAMGASANVTVLGTNVENVTQVGLRATTTAGTTTVAIVNSNFTNSGFGVWADARSSISVTTSTASNNSSVGFISQSTVAGTQGVMSVIRSTSSGNGVGFQAGGSVGSGFMNLSADAIFQNGTGVVIGGNGNCKAFTQGGQGTNSNDGVGVCNSGTIANQ